jgi:ribosomal protein S18 acetylase RimI-like enzyme
MGRGEIDRDAAHAAVPDCGAAISLGEYDPDEYEAVHRLWERSDLWLRPSDGREQVALKLTRDPDLFLVARSAGRIIGTAMGGWDGRRAYVYHLAVDPDWRRRGVAGALMDELEDRLRRKGALKVKLQVIAGNDASRGFFAQRGYDVETICIPYGKELVEGGSPRDWPRTDAPQDNRFGTSDESEAR